VVDQKLPRKFLTSIPRGDLHSGVVGLGQTDAVKSRNIQTNTLALGVPAAAPMSAFGKVHVKLATARLSEPMIEPPSLNPQN
jgi:hypothetical protein